MRFSHIGGRVARPVTRPVPQYAALICAGLTLGPGSAFSATVMPEHTPVPESAMASASLSTILQVDALGFACIREEDIDRAFHMSGKGMRLPQTCLPHPCKSALTQPDLAALIGRAPTEAEWDDYYSRYADTCRREVVAFAPDPAPDASTADATDDPIAAFWTPLAQSYGPNAPIRQRLTTRPNLPPIRSTPGPAPGSVTTPMTSGIPSLESLTASDTTGENGDPDTPALPPADLQLVSSSEVLATPLPSAIWLMGVALLGWVGLRRRLIKA